MANESWVERFSYFVVPVVRLPVPTEMDSPVCMTRSRAWLRRYGRQLFPTHTVTRCCWHHQGDWHVVAENAVRLVRRAQGEGYEGERIGERAVDVAVDEGIAGWYLDALTSLVAAGMAIQVHCSTGEREYIDGRHRAAAMLDAGVRETVVVRFDVLDPTTGRPFDSSEGWPPLT